MNDPFMTTIRGYEKVILDLKQENAVLSARINELEALEDAALYWRRYPVAGARRLEKVLAAREAGKGETNG